MIKLFHKFFSKLYDKITYKTKLSYIGLLTIIVIFMPMHLATRAILLQQILSMWFLKDIELESDTNRIKSFAFSMMILSIIILLTLLWMEFMGK